MPFDTYLPLTTVEPDPFFDFTIQSLRAATYKFVRVESLTGIIGGEIHPIRESPPTLSHDTSRSVKRTLTLTLDVEDTAAFDTIRDRVHVSMILGDGREFPLGVYMAADASAIPTTRGDLSTIALVDEMFVLAQKISTSFGVTLSTSNLSSEDGVSQGSVYLALQRFLDRYPLYNPLAELGPTSTGEPRTYARPRGVERNIAYSEFVSSGSWQAGTDGTTVINDLAVQGDYFTPWMGNDGTFRMIRTLDPDTMAPSLDFDEQENVIRDSITRSDDLLEAPNRIVVTSNSGSGSSAQGPVVGTYDVPNSAPYSIQNRGFVIADVSSRQIATRSQANAIARNIALTQNVVERVELSTPPDPRHDSYDIVRWDGVLWLETSWSMTLAEGASMRHGMQRIYL
jgi:hypothetical protein